jgi:tetratricopeptide (TPR) repeat protein
MGTTPKARWQALAVLEQALARHPECEDIRRHLVRIAMSLGRWTDAQVHLHSLLASFPADDKLEYLQGYCLEGTGDYLRAAAWYEQATQHAPQQIAAWSRLANLLQNRLDRGPRAREVLDRMVTANDQSFEAYLIRARFYRERGLLEPALSDSDRARRLAPSEPDVLLAAADIARAAGTLDETRTDLRKGLEVHAKDSRLYLALASLELQANRPAEAIACLEQGLKALPDRADLLQRLADLLISQGRLDQAGELAARLRKAGWPLAQAGYWDARIRMQQRHWVEAGRMLETARVQLAVTPEWLAPVDLALGQCYEQLNDNDRRLAVYRRAVALDPSSVPARLGLGSALLAVGRMNEAIGEYWRLVKLPDVPEDGWTALAQALLLRNLKLPPEQQDWREVEDALEQAARRNPDAVPVILLRANPLAARSRLDQARDLLEKARTKQPELVELWTALAALTEQLGNRKAALDILEEAGRRLGPRVDLRLARVQYLVQRGGSKARQALAELERDLEQFPSADQPRLLRALADLYARNRDSAGVERACQRLAEQQPGDLWSRLRLVDLYLQTGNDGALERVLAEVRRLEGEEGAQWRLGEVARAIMRARAGDKQDLPQARGHLREIARRRPDWARVPLLAAAIDELEGKPERAILNYQRALELRDHQPAVVQRLAQYLYERRRYGEANHAIRKLEEQIPVRGSLAKLATEIALANQDVPRALDLARQAISRQATDYRDQLWLGRILESAGQWPAAEETLRAAVRRAETVADPWVALVRFLAATRQTAKAEAVFQETQRRLPPDPAPLALAACEEALGRLDQAEEKYQAALSESSDDFVVVKKATDFYLRLRAPGKAEPLLRRLIDPALVAPAEQVAWARRQLAFVLAAAGSDLKFAEALALVEQNLANHHSGVDDQRAKARVLATRPERQREALRLLEASLPSQPLAPEDQFLLARLCEVVGDRPRARDQMVRLLAANGHNGEYLAACVRNLLRWGETGEARRWFARLERLEPRTPRTLEIEAELMQYCPRSAGVAR